MKRLSIFLKGNKHLRFEVTDKMASNIVQWYQNVRNMGASEVMRMDLGRTLAFAHIEGTAILSADAISAIIVTELDLGSLSSHLGSILEADKEE